MVRVPTHREPTHPGEMFVEEFLRPLGLTQRDLAQGIHVPYQRVNELRNRRRGVTPSTALRLAKYFGTSPDFWMNLQLRVRHARARRRITHRDKHYHNSLLPSEADPEASRLALQGIQFAVDLAPRVSSGNPRELTCAQPRRRLQDRWLQHSKPLGHCAALCGERVVDEGRATRATLQRLRPSSVHMPQGGAVFQQLVAGEKGDQVGDRTATAAQNRGPAPEGIIHAPVMAGQQVLSKPMQAVAAIPLQDVHHIRQA